MRLLRRNPFGLLTRFALVGVAATILYAVLALAFGRLLDSHAGAWTSLLAYGVAAVFSYLAHRAFTFASDGDRAAEIPRFIVVTATGAAISFAVPAVVQTGFGLPLAVAVLLVCLVIPLINFLVLDRWVFRDRRSFSEQAFK